VIICRRKLIHFEHNFGIVVVEDYLYGAIETEVTMQLGHT